MTAGTIHKTCGFVLINHYTHTFHLDWAHLDHTFIFRIHSRIHCCSPSLNPALFPGHTLHQFPPSSTSLLFCCQHPTHLLSLTSAGLTPSHSNWKFTIAYKCLPFLWSTPFQSTEEMVSVLFQPSADITNALTYDLCFTNYWNLLF